MRSKASENQIGNVIEVIGNQRNIFTPMGPEESQHSDTYETTEHLTISSSKTSLISFPSQTCNTEIETVPSPKEKRLKHYECLEETQSIDANDEDYTSTKSYECTRETAVEKNKTLIKKNSRISGKTKLKNNIKEILRDMEVRQSLIWNGSLRLGDSSLATIPSTATDLL